MYQTKNKGRIYLAHIMFFFICLATMNVINRYYYFIFIAFGLFCITTKRKLYMDMLPMSALFLLAVSWVVFSPDSTASVLSMIKPFTYLFCYIMGMGLLNDDIDFSENTTPFKNFYLMSGAVAIGSFAHYLLNWVTNLSLVDDRNTVDFWTKTIMAATGQAALACLPLAAAVACVFCKCNVKLKIASWVTIVLIIMYNLVLSGRTLFVLLIVLILSAFIHRLITQKEGKLRLLIIFLAIVLLFVFAYQINLLGMKTYFENSPMYERFFAKNNATDLDEDTRMENKMFYLQNLLNYPWGGGHMHDIEGYAHDIYLDTYDQASVFAFVGVVVYMLNTLVHFIKCIKDQTLPFALRQVVFCLYVAIYVEFMIEPILVGMPWMFASFCLIDGYVSRILMHNKKVMKKNA